MRLFKMFSALFATFFELFNLIALERQVTVFKLVKLTNLLCIIACELIRCASVFRGNMNRIERYIAVDC